MNKAFSSMQERLTAKAVKLGHQREEQVIATVYADATNRNRVITRGEFVIPGEQTRRTFPSTTKHPFHFRKTFTPDSGPIKRGESPRMEFEKTRVIQKLIPGKIPEPLGFDEWIYRSGAVCGKTLHALSPFSDLSYEDGLQLNPDKPETKGYAKIVIGVCQVLDELHAKGYVHGDMTLHNAMCTHGPQQLQPMLIDLASSLALKDMPPAERDGAIADDFSELYRDLVLIQYHVGEINSPHAHKSIENMGELFPDDILCMLKRLQDSDNNNENDIS
jgi:hypothetical protein